MLTGSSEHAHNKMSGEAGESRDPGGIPTVRDAT